MNAIHFDVNLISKINYRKSYHDKDYVWREEETVIKYKTVLLFFKVKDGFKVNPAGFYVDKSYSFYENDPVYVYVTNDYILNSGYLIKGKEVWYKPYVGVDLGYKSSVGKYFDSDQEASDWIDKLKGLSGKIFEVILC